MNEHSRFGRLAPVLAAAGGLAYAVEGAIVVRAPQPDHHWHAGGYAVEAAFVVALIATIPLPTSLGANTNRLAGWFARLAQVGFTAMLVSAVASLGAGGTVLGPAFLLGVLASLAGLLGLTIAAARTRADIWWTAPVAFVGLILSMALGNHGGGILFGIAWIGISIALRNRTGKQTLVTATAGPPKRDRDEATTMVRESEKACIRRPSLS
jgi:hypothetical protein